MLAKWHVAIAIAMFSSCSNCPPKWPWCQTTDPVKSQVKIIAPLQIRLGAYHALFSAGNFCVHIICVDWLSELGRRLSHAKHHPRSTSGDWIVQRAEQLLQQRAGHRGSDLHDARWPQPDANDRRRRRAFHGRPSAI